MQAIVKPVSKKFKWAQGLLVIFLFLAMSTPAMAADITAGLLRGFDGSFHSLDEYTGKGKWTVVMLWASDCHACNAEAKQYVKFHKAHKDKNATILGVSLDGETKKADANKFIERHGVTFPNLIEEPGKIENMYASLSGQQWIGTPHF